ncbi:MAG TPA: MBL fold metallo-hydrolase [Candidatus Omnitrophota bacterium]|nr:MBL fold metallo-hydrolase [Candidatus Omnitrophota bacterium]
MHPDVTGFFDPATSSVSYVVGDPASGNVAIIDPVLDYDPRAGRVSTHSADRLADFVRERGLAVKWVLDTHVHADHMSALSYLRDELGAPGGIGAHVTDVQETFRGFYSVEPEFPADGSQFDRLFADGDTFSLGKTEGRVLHIPGHTPACVAYLIGDALFTGDALLMPDFGTARCDFPGGDARQLHRSIRRLLELPPATRVFVGHDYGPGGRDVAWETTIAAQKAGNVHIRDGVSEEVFVELRAARDATLELPALMLAAVQVNIRAGRMPPPEANGVSYLKIPVTRG